MLLPLIVIVENNEKLRMVLPSTYPAYDFQLLPFLAVLCHSQCQERQDNTPFIGNRAHYCGDCTFIYVDKKLIGMEQECAEISDTVKVDLAAHGTLQSTIQGASPSASQNSTELCTLHGKVHYIWLVAAIH